SGKDARLVGDLEKLLGKKLEIEALELEQDRQPAGRFNDGQRAWRDASGGEAREAREPRESRETRETRAPRPPSAPRAPRAPADPFFAQPYEAKPAGDAPPQWDVAQRD